jgi:hypothetical protein
MTCSTMAWSRCWPSAWMRSNGESVKTGVAAPGGEQLAARMLEFTGTVTEKSWDAKRAGHAYVILDGTLIPIDRVAADRPSYSGKHKKHGMNLQVIVGPHGDTLWVSGALPGSVHDKKAEWVRGALYELEQAGATEGS